DDAEPARDRRDAHGADALPEPRGRDVERARQRLARRDAAVELLVEVLRAPRARRRRHRERAVVEPARERDRRPADDRLQRSGGEEGLEGAPHRAARLRAAIELALAVLAPADERDHLAGLGAKRHETRLELVRSLREAREVLLELREALAHRARREQLQVQLE